MKLDKPFGLGVSVVARLSQTLTEGYQILCDRLFHKLSNNGLYVEYTYCNESGNCCRERRNEYS